jgi:hypothetical protein
VEGEQRDMYGPPRRSGGERRMGLAALVAAGALPVVLWHELLGKMIAGFDLGVGYLLTGASGFLLIALGLLASLPVVLSIGRDPESRLYPRSRRALAGWGVSLYLLGVVLVVQIAAIAHSW